MTQNTKDETADRTVAPTDAAPAQSQAPGADDSAPEPQDIRTYSFAPGDAASDTPSDAAATPASEAPAGDGGGKPAEADVTFADLGLSQDVLSAVTDAGYTTPTPIQAQAIPKVLAARDVLGIAQTGTGKTASFTLPMIDILGRGRARARMPRSLILEPTRELAAQVADNFEKYGKNHKLSMALLIGGVSFEEQDRKLDRGVDVLIATPGRLLDHFERGKLMLTGCQIMVVDEADRMLDMGFIPDIERIFKLVPFTRQTLFFSATMPPEITRLTQAFLQNPVRVEVARPASTAKTITQGRVTVGEKEKRAALRELLSGEEIQNAIVFCNRKRDIGTVQRSLERHNFNAGALHGDMDQRARMAMLDGFRKGKITILVASDVAARGLDIPAVSHVVNFDVPTHAEDYVHRIGRTGRAGREGKAFTICTPRDSKYIEAIEKLVGQDLPVLTLKSVEAPAPAASEETGEAKKTGRKRGGRKKRAEDSAKDAQAPSGRESKESNQDSRPHPEQKQPEAQADNRRGRGRRGRRQDDDGPTPVGLGDHVPAFLLRPVPLPKSQRASVEKAVSEIEAEKGELEVSGTA